MGKSRYKIVTKEPVPYFLTCSTVNWLPVFSNPIIANIIIDSLSFLHKENRMLLHAYVIMENHIHIIASSSDLLNEIRKFKSFTARKSIDWYKQHDKQWILKQLRFHKAIHKTDQDFQFWQEGYHPQLVSNEKILLNKLEYIHNNPVQRGYVDKPEDWRYSSYRNYIKREAVLPIQILT